MECEKYVRIANNAEVQVSCSALCTYWQVAALRGIDPSTAVSVLTAGRIAYIYIQLLCLVNVRYLNIHLTHGAFL